MKVPIIDLRAQYQAIETDVTGAVQDVIERQDFIRGKEVDLFEMNGHAFVQMAGVGFDAQVIKETNLETKKIFGPMAYVMAAMKVSRIFLRYMSAISLILPLWRLHANSSRPPRGQS